MAKIFKRKQKQDDALGSSSIGPAQVIDYSKKKKKHVTFFSISLMAIALVGIIWYAGQAIKLNGYKSQASSWSTIYEGSPSTSLPKLGVFACGDSPASTGPSRVKVLAVLNKPSNISLTSYVRTYDKNNIINQLTNKDKWWTGTIQSFTTVLTNPQKYSLNFALIPTSQLDQISRNIPNAVNVINTTDAVKLGGTFVNPPHLDGYVNVNFSPIGLKSCNDNPETKHANLITQPAISSSSIDIDTSTAGSTNWKGFGVNWGGAPYTQEHSANNWSKYVNITGPGLGSPGKEVFLPWSDDQAQYDADTQYLAKLQPSYERMTFDAIWFSPNNKVGEYNWNSTAMLDRIKDLKFFQKHNINIVLGFWGYPDHDGIHNPGGWVKPELQVALLNRLIHHEGFTNIKYVVWASEPDGNSSHPYDEWVKDTKAVYSAYKAADLIGQDQGQVQLVGPTLSTPMPSTNPDSVNAPTWVGWTTKLGNDPVSTLLGAYDWHQYPKVLGTGDNGMPPLQAVSNESQQAIISQTISSLSKTQYGNGKPIFMTELAPESGTVADTGNAKTYAYGVAMIDYAVQAAKSGVKLMLPFCYSPVDPKLQNVNCGMLDSNGSLQPRPWYYAYSLLTHSLPPKSDIKNSIDPATNLDTLVAKLPGRNQWSVIVVNMVSNVSRSATINFTGNQVPSHMQAYRFSANPGVREQLPSPDPATHGNQLTVTVPPLSAEVISTQDLVSGQ